jgi:hypothetical protein
MHHFEDVRDADVRFLADTSSGNDGEADRFAFTGDSASLSDSDDTEWHQGSAMRAARVHCSGIGQVAVMGRAAAAAHTAGVDDRHRWQARR